jgi:hypothetical protein
VEFTTHAIAHCSESICELGTADGYNTETPERLHIEFAKRAYKAMNRHNFFNQMMTYLEQRKQVAKFDSYLHWAISKYAARAAGIEKETHEEPT